MGNPKAFVADLLAKIAHGKEDVLEQDLAQLHTIVANDSVEEHVPILDRNSLPQLSENRNIVKYVGMVQDMLQPEFFLGKTPDGRRLRYRDYTTEEDEEPSFNTMMDIAGNLEERQPLVIVPVPFQATSQPNLVSPERATYDDTREDPKVMQPEDGNECEGHSKRDRDLSVLEEDSNSKRKKRGARTPFRKDWWPPGTMQSCPDQCPVLAKLYYAEGIQDQQLQLNQVVEFCGVLEPFVQLKDSSSYDERMMLDDEPLPPGCLLPRLHILTFRVVDVDRLHVPKRISLAPTECRQQAVHLLSQHVFGENNENRLVAAEALLLTLLSMAERAQNKLPVRTPSDTILGTMSLNLVTRDAAACRLLAQRLQCVLEQLVSVVSLLSLSDWKMTPWNPPRKERGRLQPSPLQLPNGGSTVVIDSSNSSVVEAPDVSLLPDPPFEALKSLVERHTVPYKFEGGSSYDFEAADSRLVVVSSHASRNLFACTLTLAVDDVAEVGAQNEPTETVVETIRSYLVQCRNPHDGNNNIALSRDLLENAKETFVNRRAAAWRTNEKKASESDFHRWLTLTRLHARSRHARAASLDDWCAALRLDDSMQQYQ